ncbi:MAG: 2-C-methyl-D-erythritol 2,4-cyclodiphosphate synthase [Cryomorphaceae bacterium]|nr:MAG: 2-C-methyl-D-erythritol 2,4-cyclodiphosphate synthase [Cryomorphaceae bacterium]
MNIRIGFGFDVHRLDEGQPFFLGGIKIPHSKGALGHSDADVLIHTICDAILGAADLRDIGFHFPDTDGKYKGIDSKILLKDVMALVRKEGYEISNIDATIALQVPKINPYVPEMKSVLAQTMGVSPGQISIKATTTEKLSFVGREEGISAYAVALIHRP